MIFLGLMALIFSPKGFSTIPNFPILLLVLSNGLTFSTSTIFFYMGLQSEGATNASMFGLLVPIFTALMGYLLLSEVLNVVQFIGGIVILTGSFLLSRLKIKAPGSGNP